MSRILPSCEGCGSGSNGGHPRCTGARRFRTVGAMDAPSTVVDPEPASGDDGDPTTRTELIDDTSDRVILGVAGYVADLPRPRRPVGAPRVRPARAGGWRGHRALPRFVARPVRRRPHRPAMGALHRWRGRRGRGAAHDHRRRRRLLRRTHRRGHTPDRACARPLAAAPAPRPLEFPNRARCHHPDVHRTVSTPRHPW